MMIQITREQLIDLSREIQDFLPEFDGVIRDDYSGRFMYGRTCVAFVTDGPIKLHGAVCAILAAAEAKAEEAGLDYTSVAWYDLTPNTDSMGRSSILYYPNLEVID